jgi:hypothetical protein
MRDPTDARLAATTNSSFEFVTACSKEFRPRPNLN